MSLNYPEKVVQLFKTSQHNKFQIKITFAVTISKDQVQTLAELQYIYRHLSFPWPAVCGIFLILFLLQRCFVITEGIDSLNRMTSSTVYREVLQRFNYINKYMSIKY